MGSHQEHPVVREFFSGKKIYELLKSEAEGGDPLLKALFGIHAAARGELPLEEAHAAAGKVVLDKSVDPVLAALFLGSWSELAYRLVKLDEMHAIIGRMRSLIDEKSSPEMRAFLLIQDGLYRSGRGDKEGRLDLLRQAIETVPAENPYYGKAVTVLAGFLSQLGRGVEAEDALSRLEQVHPGSQAPAIAFARFIRHVEAGEVAAAETSLATLEACGESADRWRRNSVAYKLLLNCMKLRWSRDATGGEIPGEARGDEQWEGWAPVVDMLLAGHAGEALDAARARAEEWPENALAGIGFDTFNLIRAELSNGNSQAAVRIMKLREERGNLHPLDGFFMARADLLSGRDDRARSHFSKLMDAVVYYRCESRLDLELRMSCELTAADVMKLVNWVRSSPSSGSPPKLARGTEVEKKPRGVARLVGNSRELDSVREALMQVAPLDVPVLITGPTGTGKELVARAIHDEGPRSAQPYLAINCGAIAEGLLESELFGHEQGAFTGAARAHSGLFESAGEGTILLDEIGEIPSRLQVALLRVLESGEVRPVGASRPRRIACRILAATNADLATKAEAGEFRKDLLYRLRRLEIAVPPLSERADDVLPLADYFLSIGRHDGRRPVMSAALRDALLTREWPGNVRELKNVVERMRLLNSDKLNYDLEDLGTNVQRGRASRSVRGGKSRGPGDGTAGVLRSGRNALRRSDRLKELFAEHGKLTRSEVARIMSVSLPTATRDLRALCDEGIIDKVMPSRSPRSHYFRLRGEG